MGSIPCLNSSKKSDWLRSMAAQSGTQGTFKMLQAGGSTAQCKAALKLSASSLVIRVANCPPTNFNTLHTAKGIKNESLYKTVRLFGWGLLCAKSSPAAIRALAVSTSWGPVERRARNTEHLYRWTPQVNERFRVQAPNKLIPSHPTLRQQAPAKPPTCPPFNIFQPRIGIQQIEVARLW